MKRLIPFLALGVFLALSGCDSLEDAEVIAQRMADGTATVIWEEAAISLALTVTAEYRQTREAGPTETPSVIEAFVTELAPGPAVVSTPEIIGMITIRHNAGFVWYFEEVEDISDFEQDRDAYEKRARVLRLLAGGMSLPVVDEIHGGRYLQVLITCPMELHDLGLTEAVLASFDPEQHLQITGETVGEEHPWDHAPEIHGHCWNGTSETATVPEGMTYLIENSTLEGRLVNVTLLPAVWIRAADVESP